MPDFTSAERKEINKQLDDGVKDIIKLSVDADRARASHGLHELTSHSAHSLTGKGSSHVDIIRECRKMYRSTGIIKNLIDLMPDFAIEGIDIVHEDEEQQAFYRAWAKKVRLLNRSEHIVRSYFKDGNVPIYSTDAKITNKQIKDIVAKADMHTFKEGKEAKNIIPVKYEIYNMLNLKKMGPKGFKTVFTKIDEDIAKLIKKTGQKTPEEKIILDSIPKRIIDAVKATTGSNKDIFIPLGKEENDPNLTILYYKKDDYQDWADPIIFSILDDIKYKKLLREADKSAAKNVIDAITVFKLGNTKEGFPPTKKQMEKMAALLKTPTKTKTLVWNDLISIETAYAPIDQILGDAKYKAVNDDILAGFGISEVIVNGKGGNYSNSFLSVKSLLERLETARNELKSWLEGELRRIMKAFRWKKMPKIRFSRMNLIDANAEKQILLQLVDRNIISTDTFLSYFDEDFGIEFQRMKNEKKIREKEGMDRNSPIEKKEDNPFNTPDQNEKDFDPRGQNQDGRPPGNNAPQQKKRNTNPVGISSFEEMMAFKDEALRLYERVEKIISLEYCKLNDASNKKSLRKDQKEELDKIIFTVFSNLSVNCSSEETAILKMFSEIGKVALDGHIAKIFESLRNKNKDVASAQQIRDMRASAFAVVNYSFAE